MQVKKEMRHPGIKCYQLESVKTVSLTHQGSYEQLGRSYKKIIDYITEEKLDTASPSREVYIKGPGMFFRGNAKKYITELQMRLKQT